MLQQSSAHCEEKQGLRSSLLPWLYAGTRKNKTNKRQITAKFSSQYHIIANVS